MARRVGKNRISKPQASAFKWEIKRSDLSAGVDVVAAPGNE